MQEELEGEAEGEGEGVRAAICNNNDGWEISSSEWMRLASRLCLWS